MISLIVAVEKTGGIGNKGHLPWPFLRADMNWFKNSTLNNTVLMGKTTYESLPAPLKNRRNVVITSSTIEGVECYRSPSIAVAACSNSEIYIIGGATLYNSMVSMAHRLLITEIDSEFECDTHINTQHYKSLFPTHLQTTHHEQDGIKFTISEYTK